MTRTEIKQAADDARETLVYRRVGKTYFDQLRKALIAADELIDKLGADKAKLRDALRDSKLAMSEFLGPVSGDLPEVLHMIEEALKDTSDE